MSEELIPRLIEWRDARRTILNKPLLDASEDDRLRLSVAEHRLMEIAGYYLPL